MCFQNACGQLVGCWSAAPAAMQAGLCLGRQCHPAHGHSAQKRCQCDALTREEWADSVEMHVVWPGLHASAACLSAASRRREQILVMAWAWAA